MAFKDTQGTTWDLAITIGGVKRVKRMLDVDLFDVVAVTDGKTSLMGRLMTDHALLVDVAFALLLPQIEAAGITDQTFAEHLGGEAFAQMRTTLFTEMRRFFQGSGRADQAVAMERMERMEELAIAAATEGISQISPEDAVSRAMAAGMPSTNGPASAASSQTA